MSRFRLEFSGIIKKVEQRMAGPKPIAECSICRKNATKPGEPESFTWVRVTIWEPAEFQVSKLVPGSFIAGSGQMTLRSYEGKNGKATQCEVRCSSFDVDVELTPDSVMDAPAPAPATRRPAARPAPATSATDDEPPF